MEPARRKTVRILCFSIATALVSASLCVGAARFGFLERFDAVAFDATVRALRAGTRAPDAIAVVLIDEASLQAMNPVVGRWPWPRAVWADLLDYLAIGHPRAVVFDILFSEDASPVDSAAAAGDRAFADATRRAGRTVHAMKLFVDAVDEANPGQTGRPLPTDVGQRFARGTGGEGPVGASNTNYLLPLPALREAAAALGVVTFTPDADGVFRRTRPLRRYQGAAFPVLGLTPFVGPMVENDRAFDPATIPTDRRGRVCLYPYGGFDTFSVSGLLASWQGMLEGRFDEILVDPAVFEDRIVFIGASAVGVEDLKPTPMSAESPGVYLHATLAGNILEGGFLQRAPAVLDGLLALCLGFLAAVTVSLPRRTVWRMTLPVVLGLALTAIWTGALAGGIWLSLASPAAAMLTALGVATARLLLTEEREKTMLKNVFSQYVSAEVLETVLDDHRHIASTLRGSREEISVLFADIRGFTNFSDAAAPEAVVRMLNCHFSRMTDLIFEGGGTVDKFMGDAVMAFWGAPVRRSDHAEQAVRTALRMLEGLDTVNAELAGEGIAGPIRIGIGICTGPAILGNIGSARKLNYTVIGDTVNIAARLEALTKSYGVPILLAEATARRLPPAMSCRTVDACADIRGKSCSLKILTPEGGTHPATTGYGAGPDSTPGAERPMKKAGPSVPQS